MNDLERARASAETMMAQDAASRMLGIEIEIPAPGEAIATMTVRDDMVNGFGVCHGGLVFTLADTAFAFACNAYNDETLSIEADINWLRRSHRGDRLVASATEDRREGRHGHYRIVVHNQHGDEVANFRGHSVSRGRPLFDEAGNDT